MFWLFSFVDFSSFMCIVYIGFSLLRRRCFYSRQRIWFLGKQRGGGGRACVTPASQCRRSCEGLLSLQLPDPLAMWSCLITRKLKVLHLYYYNSYDKVVIYHEELPLIKLLNPSVMWFCMVTWHIKYFISPLALEQWRSNKARWWLTVTGLHR